MIKRITIAEGAKSKTTSKELIGLTNTVKSKTGAVGSEGVLKGNIFYRILKGGFMIF